MPIQKTLCIIKPDACRMQAVGDIVSWFEEESLDVVAAKKLTLTDEQAIKFYKEHQDKPFFSGLIKFMTSGPLLAVVLEGEDCIRRYRDLMGDTDPKKADTYTMRAMYGTEMPENAVHGSDSEESAKREIRFFFKADSFRI